MYGKFIICLKSNSNVLYEADSLEKVSSSRNTIKPEQWGKDLV